MFKRLRQKYPLAASLLIALIPTIVMMATLAFPMYSRNISEPFFRFSVSGCRRMCFLAGEAALLWTLWTAFIHCGGTACAVLFGLFLALEFAPAVLLRTSAGSRRFLYQCLIPTMWTLSACVLAIPARGRLAIWAKRIWALVPIFGVTQYLVYLAYIIRFGQRISAEAIMSLFETNAVEARDFLTEQIGLFPLSAGLAVLFATWLAVCFAARRIRPTRRASALCVFCALCLGAVLIYQKPTYLPNNLISDFKTSYVQYRKYLSVFDSLKKGRSDPSRQISNLNVAKEGNGEACVIVIGESSTRRHMSRYGYERPTTPWLCSNDPELQKSLIVLENAFSCMTHTSRAVPMALSMFNNYDPILQLPEGNPEKRHPNTEIARSFSLIEILEEADVRTHWFSNQEKIGAYNNIITAHSQATSEQKFLADRQLVDRKSGHQDEELVPLLKLALNSVEGSINHVIFVHLSGNHGSYKKHAPADWPYLPPVKDRNLEPNVAERIDDYDRSISYTDFVLGQIVETLANSKIPVISMLYFADHGEDVDEGYGHNFDAFRPVMAEIPVIIWLSEGYRARWPETAAQLRANEKRIFTNDLICELALGLNHVSCDNLNPERQLTSPHYGVTAENARFWNGVLLKSLIPDLKD